MKNKKNGISLIILVITIIVIIILAGAVILSLSNNNPMLQANKAVYLNDLRNFQSELSLYESTEIANKSVGYDPTLLQADINIVSYDGIIVDGKNINDLIPSLEKSTKYFGKFYIINGQLVYSGYDTNEQNWAKEIGVRAEIMGEPQVTIIPSTETLVKPGTDIVYTIEVSSNTELTNVDLNGKVEVLDNNGVVLPVQPNIIIEDITNAFKNSIMNSNEPLKINNISNNFYIDEKVTTIDSYGRVKVMDDLGNISFLKPYITIDNVSNSISNDVEKKKVSLDTSSTKKVKITIKTDNLPDGSYKVRVKSGAVKNSNNMYNSQDTVSQFGFDIDNNAPANPVISASPSVWTTGDVTVTLIYADDTAIKEYSFDGITWSNYTLPIVVTNNNTTIYAKRKRSGWKSKWCFNINCSKYR